MPDEAEGLTGDLAAMYAALRQLQPAATSIDRDRLMYLAGQASASANVPAKAQPVYKNWWALSTAALLMLSLTLGGMLAARHSSQVVIYVDNSDANRSLLVGEANHPDSSAEHGANYLKLRNLVVARGVDALPMAKSSQHSQAAPTPSPVFGGSLLGS